MEKWSVTEWYLEYYDLISNTISSFCGCPRTTDHITHCHDVVSMHLANIVYRLLSLLDQT